MRQFASLDTGIGERLQRRAQFAYLTEQFRVLAGVRNHGGMERFGTECGCTPLEEVDGVGAHGHVGQGVTHRFPVAFASVQRLPLHRRSGMFHDVPWFAERQRIHERIGTGQLVEVGFAFVEVVVVRHEIHFLRPSGVVHAALVGGDHEVRGERLVGADFGDRVTFGFVEVKQHVVAEPFKIKLLSGVDHGIGAHEPWDEHFVETGHLLSPERGAPRLVERADGAVLAAAPCAEGFERIVGVVVAIVPPVFVAHMPCRHIRVGAVAFGEFAA